MAEQTYTIRIKSPFILTPTRVKQGLGIGFHLLSLEIEKDLPEQKLNDLNETFEALVKVGYRALARAYHPDLGGDAEKMVLINRAKKELLDLLESLK